MFVGGAIGIAAVTVIAVVMMMGPRSASVVVPPIDAATAVAPTPDAPVNADAREAETLTFKIVSNPVGASVYEGSRLLGVTPYDYLAPADNDKITLYARLEGYDDAEFYIIPLVDKKRAKDMVIQVPLTKPKKGAQPAIKIRPGNGNRDTGTSAGSGSATRSDLGQNPYPK